MAPIRRYLRITKFSVLEVRIYLEKPSDAPWLLSSRDPVLPRIMKEIRPKVLPKLREENENARKKGTKKKKGIKDIASQDDFEVVLFLTDSSSRHSLITKQKQFTSKAPIKSTSNKLTGWLSDKPIQIEDDDVPALIREESDEGPALNDIPVARSKRKVHDLLSDDDLFVGEDEDTQIYESRYDESIEDKKKLALNTSYDGFSIYGKILCLIVKRKGAKKQAMAQSDQPSSGSQMMEQWVSTQANQEPDMSDND